MMRLGERKKEKEERRKGKGERKKEKEERRTLRLSESRGKSTLILPSVSKVKTA